MPIPQILLSTAENPLTAALPETPGLSPADRATERFAIVGNAIVTGGAGDLGLAACRALLEHGLQGLCIFDMSARLETSKDSIQSLLDAFPSAKIITESVDVTDEQNIQNAVAQTAQNLGSVDILLCFAGVARGGMATDMPLDLWKQVIDVNTTGCFLSAKHVAKQMITQGTGGSIVFTSSISGHRVLYPMPGQTVYNVSKAAIFQLKSSLAAEWARHGIRVNSISPGFMNTAMTQNEYSAAYFNVFKERTPLGRMGEPSEVAGPIIMLCSRAGRYLTGIDIPVDGGSLVF